MPPKIQITKDQILAKAYEYIQLSGCNHLTARLLAKELNCSTQPIYKSFRDMEELKAALADRAVASMLQYMNNYSEEHYDPFLSKILGYVQFSIEETKLFQLIFTSNGMRLTKSKELISKNSELERNMIIYANGIIMMYAFGTMPFQWNEVREMIIQTYETFQKAQ